MLKELVMSSRRYPAVSSGALFYVAAAVACATGSGAAAFVSPSFIRRHDINIIKANTNGITTTTTTTTTLGAWFGGGNNNAKQQDGEKDTKSSSSTTPPPPSRLLDGFGRPVVDDGNTGNDGDIGGEGQMGRTATTLESFKASQEVGKRTAQVLTELSGMTVEGAGPLGIKAFVDGRGRAVGIKVDASLLGGGREDGANAAAAAGVSAEDVQDAITKAFQDAYDKSLEQQEEKMMPLYSDLGLAS